MEHITKKGNSLNFFLQNMSSSSTHLYATIPRISNFPWVTLFWFHGCPVIDIMGSDW